MLEKGKVDRIDQLIGTPIPTVEISESIFSKLFRVFSSQDSFFAYDFKDEALKQDWNAYKNKNFWATKGFEAMQDAINSVWVVDLPEIQGGDYPEPVNKLVNIKNVISIGVDEDNNCEYVIFKEGDLIYAYDDNTFRAFDSGFKLIEEVPHGLGYTPARMMWTDKLESKDSINKESPITKELSDLDWLLFHTASKKYMDIANAYPILVSYYMGGDSNDDSITANKQPGTSPEGGSKMGAGSHVKVNIPNPDEVDLMVNPMKYINPDVGTLEWHVKEEVRLTQKIIKSVIGVEDEKADKEAMNELQIESGFESQISVLMRVKINFEIIQKFADSTIAKLRYRNNFTGCTIDYGTKFFLKSQEDLHNNYKLAKDAGADDILLSDITDNILDTKYRDDNEGRSRANIIRDLDPMPEKAVEEAIKIKESGGIDNISFIIKMNLLNFVKRFERENVSLNQFGINTEYRVRINKILETLKTYANERLQGQTE